MNNIESLNNYKILGRNHMQVGDFDLAIENFSLFHENQPEDLEILELLGDAYMAKQQTNVASGFYSKILDIDPVNTQNLLKYSKIELSGPNYIKVLEAVHQAKKPQRYIEIGVCKGVSFSLASPETRAIGIDPEPQFDHIGALPDSHIVVSNTSDGYFASGRIKDDFQNKAFDMAFLDGMHLFEYALRDFINLEKKSNSDSVIFIHDLYPMNAETSTRERNSDFWSGDVWKLVLCISEYRPDLDLKVLPCPPTGLGVVKNLDCSSTVLEENYQKILKKFVTMSYDEITNDKEIKLKLVSAEEISQLYV